MISDTHLLTAVATMVITQGDHHPYHHPMQRVGSEGAALDLQVDQVPVVPVRTGTKVRTHFCDKKKTTPEEEEEMDTGPQFHTVGKTSQSKSEEQSMDLFICRADILSVGVVSVRG